MRRLLSVIIICAMLLSMIPLSYAGAVPGISTVYDFVDKFPVTDQVMPYSALDYRANNDLWMYAANSEGHKDITSGSTGIRWHKGSEGEIALIAQNPDVKSNDGKVYWIAFKLKVPKTENYTLALNAKPYAYGTSTYVNVYLFEASSVESVEEGLVDANKLTSAKFKSDTDSETFALGEKKLKGEEYYFVFSPGTSKKDKSVPANGTFVYLNTFTITEELPLMIESASVSLAKDALYTGEYTYANVDVESNAGGALPQDAVVVEFESSDKSVAMVNSDGEIYAVSPGTAEITVTVTDANGISKTSEPKTVTVKSRGQAETLPEELVFDFQQGFITEGEAVPVRITDTDGNRPGDGIKYTYKIDDENIVTEEYGVFTGEKIGKTNVTVLAELGDEKREFAFSVTVVGKNLLARNGVDHGQFENSIFMRDESVSGVTKDSSMWYVERAVKNRIFDYTLLEDQISPANSKLTNVAKISFDYSENLSGNYKKLIRLQTNTTYRKTENEKHSGLITLDSGKLYEYTGYIKNENVKTDPSLAKGELYYYSLTGTKASPLKNYLTEPWGATTGDHDWTQFTVPAVWLNWNGYDGMTVDPRVEFQIEDCLGGDYYIANLHLHEVSFETVDFRLTEKMVAPETYDEFETVFTALTNTGNEIISGDDKQAITAKYSSTNETVAKVSEDGIITVVSDGECEILAEVEINGVKKTGRIPLELQGLEVMFESIRAAAPESLNTGETAEAKISFYNTDMTEYSGSDVVLYYESNAPEVALIDQNGTITAKNPGTAAFTVYAEREGYTTKTEFEITITDPSPIVSAEITGGRNAEKGFPLQLYANAFHESGSRADIAQHEVVFSLCDGAPADVLEISEAGLVTGKNAGKADVQVTVGSGETAVTSPPYTVEILAENPKNKKWDFRDRPHASSALNATLETDGWCVNRDETSPTRITEALAGSYKTIRCLNTALQFSAPKADNTKEADLAIDFIVDHSGWYQPVFSGNRNATGKSANIYIDGQYEGFCDFSSGGDNIDVPVTVKLNPIYLEKGTRTLTLRAQEVGYLYPVTFAINYLNEQPEVSEISIIPQKEKLAVGESAEVSVIASLSGGMSYVFGNDIDEEPNEKRNFTLSAEGTGAVSISGASVTGQTEGEVELSAHISYDGADYTARAKVTVIPAGFAEVVLSSEDQVMKPGAAGGYVKVVPVDNLGNEMQLAEDAVLVFAVTSGDAVTIDEDGYMVPQAVGTATVSATLTMDGITHTGYLNVSVREGKTAPTYFTEEKVANARENAVKYDWAKSTVEKAVEAADSYLPHIDTMYELIPSQAIPRSYGVGYLTDPDMRVCRYCGENLTEYGTYPWIVDALNRPWKIQCPECKRLFPSNDFAKLYELGKNEQGEYDIELAHERNEKLRTETNGEVDYLKNVLYPELYNPSSELYNKDPRTGDTIDGTKWGVDDGLGYFTGREYPNGIPEVHTYVAVANHLSLWRHPLSELGTGIIRDAVSKMRDAYIYTGDKKYGQAGAILLDRIADFYPDYDIGAFYNEKEGIIKYHNSGETAGKILGKIWEANLGNILAESYDAFFDVYDDPSVISFLTEKAIKYGYEEKLVETENGTLTVTGETLRANAEKNILEELYTAVKEVKLEGNFGFKQRTLSKAAVVLDTEPLTSEMIDFVMRPGAVKNGVCTGGNVFAQILNIVDRDGFGNEASFGYNIYWATDILEMAEILNGYENVPEEYDVLAHPKYVKMLSMQTAAILAGIRRANIGDNGGPGLIGISFDKDLYMAGLNAIDTWNASDEFKQQQRILYSQILYFNNGNTADGLHYNIYTKDPESLEDEIEGVIDEYGEIDFVKSELRTGYGFASLQAGKDFRGQTSSNALDITTRDFWMYFGGGNTSHHHFDGLNIGLDAFGMNYSPDLGYPADTGTQGGNVTEQWVKGTVSHNTVVVNDRRQVKRPETGNVMHFDDSGEVKVVDVDMPNVYGQYVDTYRRTLVSVDVDDTVSYGIDFFRIIGGDEHVYSFHAQARETEISGLDMVSQPMGTYAGADIPYGDAAYSKKTDSGYNYLENVERAEQPGTGTFTADFKIEKMRGYSFTKRNWHLRLTMLNDFNLSEVALADGKPPEKGANPPSYEYILARRSGKNMDTLFTTVLEPYIGQSNIKALERVDVVRADGERMKDTEPVAAVKVTLNNGRVDYVIYAANNEVTYTVDGLFDFCGFVGVYTVSEENTDEYLRSYLLDGTKLAETKTGDAAIVGTVKDFTREPEFENFIEIELSNNIDASKLDTSALSGKLLDIENDGVRNGDYWIKSAELDGNTLRLDIGDVTTVRGFADSYDTDKGYICDIEEGQSARIALSSYETSAPVIEPIENATVSAGSSITIPVTAQSPEGRELILTGTTLPRGMSVNPDKMSVTWKPDASQVGDNHVALTVSDGLLTSTVRFTVTVYGSTTSKPSNNNSASGENTGASGGGGGGGGGGAAPETSDKTDNGETDTSDETDNGETDTSDETDNGETSPEASGETESLRFTDLTNHAWAADAINTLAQSGIIKGTSDTKFSPAANITRADFALLLVRAFELSSDNAENFADVSASDYFASELAIARNTGIVNGIGDNKFAPRNHITRQDMMVIVYRALQTLNVGFGIYDEPQYPDYSTVAPYAREAVSALISAGLVNGKNGLIAPLDYTTRAEVGVLIKRILDYTVTSSS